MRVIFFHIKTYNNTFTKISEAELVGVASLLDGEVMPKHIKSKDGTAQSLGKWELMMLDCSLFQSRLFLPWSWQSECCLLQYAWIQKTAKKREKKEKKTNPCCPCLACSSSIISTVAEVPRLKGPAWLAVLQTVHRAGQSYPQARSGRLSPRGFQSQPYRPRMWGRPLCSRCHCLSHCLHRLQYRNTSQNEHSTAIAV